MISIQSGLSVFSGAKWLHLRPDRMGNVENEARWLWMRLCEVAHLGGPSPDFRDHDLRLSSSFL